MCRRVLLSLALLAVACGGPLEPRPGTDPGRTGDAPPATAPPKSDAAPCAPSEPCAVLFEIAEVAFEVDVFEKRPAFPLPPDARLDMGQVYGSVGQGPDAVSLAPRSASVAYAGDADAFDRVIGGPFRAAVTVPANTWLAFARTTNLRTKEAKYDAVLVRQPPLVTPADVTSAAPRERDNTTIVLGGKAETTKSWVVDVTLGAEAVGRLAAFRAKHPERPLAVLVRGHVVERGRAVTADKDLVVDVGRLANDDGKKAAENLAKALQHR